MSATKLSIAFSWPPARKGNFGLSNPISISAAYLIDVVATLTQTGSPTTPSVLQVFESPDGIMLIPVGGPMTAPLDQSTWSPSPIAIPSTAQYVFINYTPCSGNGAIGSINSKCQMITDV